MMASAKVKHALLQSSFKLYEQIIADESLECEWEHRGLLFVYKDEDHFQHFDKTNELLESEFGIGAKRIPSNELVDFEPAIKPISRARICLNPTRTCAPIG